MKKLKLDLHSLNAEVLTRSQLKQVLGGDGGSGGGGTGCPSSPCTLYDPSSGQTYTSHCGFSNPGLICECLTSYGVYLPPGGQSHCVA